MSGIDEKPVPSVEKIESENMTCPNCGSTIWKQYHSYSSTTRVDLAEGSMTESDPEWYDADDWICDDCDGFPPEHIRNILRNRY